MSVVEMKWTPSKIRRYWKTKYENDIPHGALYEPKELPKAQHQFVLDKIKEHVEPGKKVLDIGTGGGWLASTLKKNGYDVVGMDVEKFCDYDFKFVLGEFSRLPFPDESLDCIVSVDVIEHLTVEQFEKGLMECRRVLKVGGMILFGTDNGERLELARSLCPECLTTYHPCQHLTSWTPVLLCSYLAWGLFGDIEFFEHRMGNGSCGVLDSSIQLRTIFLPFQRVLFPLLRVFVNDPLNKLLVVGWKL